MRNATKIIFGLMLVMCIFMSGCGGKGSNMPSLPSSDATVKEKIDGFEEFASKFWDYADSIDLVNCSDQELTNFAKWAIRYEDYLAILQSITMSKVNEITSDDEKSFSDALGDTELISIKEILTFEDSKIEKFQSQLANLPQETQDRFASFVHR